MRKVNQSKKHNEFFEDEITRFDRGLDGYIDAEYCEFEERVLSGKITEMDCKNPMWLNLYCKIKKNHSKKLIKEIAVLSANNQQIETNRSAPFKHGEYHDLDPDLD